MFKDACVSYLTTMVMVQNDIGETLLINRKKSWQGLTFPGGHVKEGESITNCAIREVKEETNIDIKNLKLVGLINWYNIQNKERFLVYCYRAQAINNDVIFNDDEGEASFRFIKDILDNEFAKGFKNQIEIFTDDNIIEYFGTYGDGKDSPLTIFKTKA